MACENPKRLKNPRYTKMSGGEYYIYCHHYFGKCPPPDLYIEVPCGECYSCQKRRMNDYRIRLLYEIADHISSAFVTLTFDNASLRRFKDDPNRAVRLFLDRCRKEYGKGLRHWFVAEYGSLNGRIHYHGIIFNTPSNFTAHKVSSLWSYGHIWLGYANSKTCNYIVKYVTKSANNGQRPPRIISSKGIGQSYLTPQQIALHKKDGEFYPFMTFGSITSALPRYYYNKIFSDDDKVQILLQSLSKPFERYVNGLRYTTYPFYKQALKQLHQRNMDLGLSPVPKVKQTQNFFSFQPSFINPWNEDDSLSIDSFVDDLCPF